MRSRDRRAVSGVPCLAVVGVSLWLIWGAVGLSQDFGDSGLSPDVAKFLQQMTPNIDQTLAQLHDPDPGVREGAANLLGQLRDLRSVQALIAALQGDPSPSVRETAAKRKQFQKFFAIDSKCPQKELNRAATTAVALDKLVAKFSLDMLAYYYMGSGIKENEDTMSSIILGTSMLTGNGTPVAGEYEVKNVLAMKIMDELGAGGSFTEYYAMDYDADLVLMGHDGPGHTRIAQDKIRVRPLRVFHGKVGRGLSVEMAVKHGPVTLLSVVEDKNKGFSFLVAEGESVPGPILKIGNTNSRYRFSLGARGFVEAWNARGPAHHCTVGLGGRGSELRKIAALMDLGFTQIC